MFHVCHPVIRGRCFHTAVWEHPPQSAHRWFLWGWNLNDVILAYLLVLLVFWGTHTVDRSADPNMAGRLMPRLLVTNTGNNAFATHVQHAWRCRGHHVGGTHWWNDKVCGGWWSGIFAAAIYRWRSPGCTWCREVVLTPGVATARALLVVMMMVVAVVVVVVMVVVAVGNDDGDLGTRERWAVVTCFSAHLVSLYPEMTSL